jgi:hypothetical protein
MVAADLRAAESGIASRISAARRSAATPTESIQLNFPAARRQNSPLRHTMNTIPHIPRGTRPDAETAERIYLVKNVTVLRATYQVRLLALKAAEHGKKLVLKVPASCRFEPSLEQLVARTRDLIEREDIA